MKIWLLILTAAVALLPLFVQAQKKERQAGGVVKTAHKRNLATLEFIARLNNKYILRFEGIVTEGQFMIQRYLHEYPKPYIMRVGETSPDKLFKIERHAQVRNKNDEPFSRLSIKYLPDGRIVDLTEGVVVVIPDYFAHVRQTAGVGGEKREDFYIKKGEVFRLAINPELEYMLAEIKDESVVISFRAEKGKKEKIEIKRIK